jgi:hypothetical protein
MNRNYLFKNLFIATAFVTVLTSAINSASGPGGGYANAPGESNCTSCHGGTIITSNNSNLNNILLNGDFHSNGYLPDSTYNITVSYKQSGKSKFGFQVTALDVNNDPIGTFTSSGNRNSKVTANVSGKTRQYIQHTFTGTSGVATDSTNWSFTWKAPNKNVGAVKFYVVVMAANNNSTNDAGDQVYSKLFNLVPSPLLSKATAGVASTNACTNTNVQFTGSGTSNPTSYNWKFLNGVPSTSTAQNPVVYFTTAGTKTAILNVKNAYGDGEPDTIYMNVVTSPTAKIANGSSASICKGDSVKLSATNQANLTYLWSHNGAKTQFVYLKDSISTDVTITSTVTGCSTTSTPFKLNWYPHPTASLSSSSNKDSFCGSYNLTLTANGNNIDSVYWFRNGNLIRKTGTASSVFTGTSNAVYSAIAKSVNACFSDMSPNLNIFVVPKIYPTAISYTKTTSDINMKWKKTIGISKIEYALNSGAFTPTLGDTALILTGLAPNTNYDITLRSTVGGPCQTLDSTIRVKTNACSNILYSIDLKSEICKGESLTATVAELYKSKYSISFEGNPYSKDTVYQFTPSNSDSLRISIIDSLSPTCPAIYEAIAYQVDMPIDNSQSKTQNVSLCGNSYTLKAFPGYSNYDFYKNNTLINSSTDSSFTYTSLNDKDSVYVVGTINSCTKIYAPIRLTVHPVPSAQFTFTRNWKDYTFVADQSGLSTYNWRIGNDVIGTTSTFVKEMSSYNNSNITVKLNVEGSGACKDSFSQSIQVPNLTSIQAILDLGIQIYPNPFSNVLNVESKGNVRTLKLIDNMGRVLRIYNIDSDFYSIETSDLSNGIYHLVIETVDSQMIQSTYIKN